MTETEIKESLLRQVARDLLTVRNVSFQMRSVDAVALVIAFTVLVLFYKG